MCVVYFSSSCSSCPFLSDLLKRGAKADGHDKQDSEQAASQRWLESWGLRRYAPWGMTLMGAVTFIATSPLCEQVLAAAFDFLFVCKPSPCKTLAKWPGNSTTTVKRKRTEGVRKKRPYTTSTGS